MSQYSLNINGITRQVEASPETPLLWVLRDNLDLPGTKFGCGVGNCGACTVHLNGVPTRSCMTPVSTVGRKKVVTIEGLPPQGAHPIKTAWQDPSILACLYAIHNELLAFFYTRRRPAKNYDRIGLLLVMIAAFLPTFTTTGQTKWYFLVPGLAGYVLILWSLVTLGLRFGIAPADR